MIQVTTDQLSDHNMQNLECVLRANTQAYTASQKTVENTA